LFAHAVPGRAKKSYPTSLVRRATTSHLGIKVRSFSLVARQFEGPITFHKCFVRATEAMGGPLLFDSTPGNGSIFTVPLPIFKGS
jgi:hypothetical protein